jgi:hypothetical protein
MTIEVLFWLLMILWAVLGVYSRRDDFRGGNYGLIGGGVLLWVLLALLGWKVFGSIIKS